MSQGDYFHSTKEELTRIDALNKFVLEFMFKLVLLIINNTKAKYHSVNNSLQVYVILFYLKKIKLNAQHQNIPLTGDNLSIAGKDLSVTGTHFSVAGNDLSVAGNDLSIAGNDLSVSGTHLSVAGNDLSVAGTNLSVTGTHLSVAGNNLLLIWNFKISNNREYCFNY
jgi:hypothetical protein